MKKHFLILVMFGFLAGCIQAGDYDLMPVRKKIVAAINGYSIDYSEAEEEYIGSEGFRESDVVTNKAITVKKGEAILSDKVFDKNTFRAYIYRPNKKGALEHRSYTVKMDNKTDYELIGWVTIDGVRYSILGSEVEDYVFLFDDSGKFYKYPAKINDGILTLLDGELFVYPSDLKIMKIAKMRDEISNVKDGYEVKYAGTKLGRIWFDYLNYDLDDNNGGQFERISFPNKPGLITINGKGLRVLKADDEAITFMILKVKD